MKNTTKNAKMVLFASLIATMILPFSGMQLAVAEDSAQENTSDRNIRDKTTERIQEKNKRELVLVQINVLANEDLKLEGQLKSETDEAEKKRIMQRINEIRNQLDTIEQNNHEKNIPQAQLETLISQQHLFEKKFLISELVQYVTSVGIDITSKEIQIGLNQNIVNSNNIDSVISDLEGLIGNDVNWHVVYSTPAESLTCNQKECEPIIGGNYVIVPGMGACSYGFQAKKGSTWGWVTAGHCADGKVGTSVFDHSGDNIGTVSVEKDYWGTYCDCAWITSSSSIVDNKVYGVGVHTITKTTSMFGQQNDTIMKSGQAGGIDFGTVSAVNVTVLIAEKGEYIRGLVRSNTVMAHGDSGGTVVESSDKGDLYGIATIHDWWGYYHTPINHITSELGVTPVLN